MPVIRAGELAIDLIDQGSGESTVLLHSAGLGAAQWRGVIAALLDRYRLIAPNQRGYGRSAPWPPDRPADFAAEQALVRAVLDQTPGKVHLVGHSLGAYLALHLAAGEPDRFASLALVEPVALGILRSEGETDALAEVGAMIEACLAAFDAGNVNAAMTHFVDYWYGPGYWEAIPKAQRLPIFARAGKMRQEVESVWRDTVPLSDYAGIALPTEVWTGAATTRAAKRMAALLSEALPDARYGEMPGAGHMAPITHAEDLAARLEHHFRRNKIR